MSNNNPLAALSLILRAKAEEKVRAYEAFLAGASMEVLREEAEKSYLAMIDAMEAASNMSLSRKLPTLPERLEDLRLWIRAVQRETHYQWQVAGHH